MLSPVEKEKILSMLAHKKITRAEADMLLKSSGGISTPRRRLQPLPMPLKIWFGILLVIISVVFVVVFSSPRGDNLREKLVILGLFQDNSDVGLSSSVGGQTPRLILGESSRFLKQNPQMEGKQNWRIPASLCLSEVEKILSQPGFLKGSFKPANILLEVHSPLNSQNKEIHILDEAERKLYTLNIKEYNLFIAVFNQFFNENPVEMVKIPYEVGYP